MNSFMDRVNNKIKTIRKHIYAYCKLLVAYIFLHLINRQLLSEEIWLIQEKRTEARDNGYHFFKYLREYHPEINALFSITKDSVDFDKVKHYDNVIEFNSFQHYVLYLAAKYDIGSQHYCAAPGPDDYLTRHSWYCNSNRKKVFLQHGITKDKIPGLCYKNNKFDAFCCAGIPEYNYIKKEFGHPEDVPKLVGFCRFDNLIGKDKNEKVVLIMPTFRMYLNPMDATSQPTEKNVEAFINSQYYQEYANILSNHQLILALNNSGYKVVFYLHYSLQAYSHCFSCCERNNIIIAHHDQYDVQELLISSSILITDYSSVFFDFAFMQKPVVYFQFDEAEYRAHHYSEGYFSYHEDGFGPVFERSDEVVSYIIERIKNNCSIEDKFNERIKGFFKYSDSHNCLRTYEMVKNL